MNGEQLAAIKQLDDTQAIDEIWQRVWSTLFDQFRHAKDADEIAKLVAKQAILDDFAGEIQYVINTFTLAENAEDVRPSNSRDSQPH